jgi:5-methylcytosine-specific restriction enzyme A
MMLELHARKPLTTKQRVELFRDHKGVCCVCGGKIKVGEKWIDEHIDPLGMTGTNCQIAVLPTLFTQMKRQKLTCPT